MSRIVLEIHIIVKNEVKMPRFLLFKLFGIVFLNFIIFKRLRQLIGAGGGLHAALDALDTGDDVVNVHPFHQLADALQVAVAAAYKLNILDLVVLNVEENLLGTGAFCLVFVHADFLSIQ